LYAPIVVFLIINLKTKRPYKMTFLKCLSYRVHFNHNRIFYNSYWLYPIKRWIRGL